jgi:hypothetical protein
LATTPTRRPLPALIALVALLLLTALVWWRVLHRGGGTHHTARPCPTQVAQTTLPAPGQITLKVLNATKRNGIAARARTTLVGDGFNVPAPAANDKPKKHIRGVAEIRYGPSGKQAATLLHYYFPGARLVPTSTRSAVVTVSLGDRYRSVATSSAVTAALQRQHIGLASTGSAGPSGTASC